MIRHLAGDRILSLVVPPACVVVTLVGLHNVWATFLCYHLGICLLWPAFDSHRRGLTVRGHLRRVGLTGGRTGAGVVAGVALGCVLALGQWLGFAVTGNLLLDGQRIAAALSRWDVVPQRGGLLLLAMLLLNGPAEELYWRGDVHRRLHRWPRRTAIAAAALAYASYHGVTLLALFGEPGIALALLAVVFAAGLLWGWLRERYGNVWPALLGHLGATVGYMAVYWFCCGG